MSAAPFTLAQYAAYLRLALAHGYRFAGFQASVDDGGESAERVIYVRHDIDYALRWVLPMAELEHAHGVSSTYCFLLDTPYYSSPTPEFEATVERLLHLGHWLGLHFDATEIPDDYEVARRVTDAAAGLERRFGADVVAVSFHWPGRRAVSHIALPGGLVNTYGPRFFEEIGYASDSNMDWRGVDLEELLTSGRSRRLQLLIHPVWWRATHAPMLDRLQALADELGIPLDELMTDEQRALVDAAT